MKAHIHCELRAKPKFAAELPCYTLPNWVSVDPSTPHPKVRIWTQGPRFTVTYYRIYLILNINKNLALPSHVLAIWAVAYMPQTKLMVMAFMR